jgi:putative tryptophan/tyrosine transport system substrate-binding protein
MPKAKVIGLLVNPRSPQGIGSNTEAEEQERDARTVVNAMGRQLIVVRASSESEINEAFAALVQQRAAGLIVASDLFLTTRMDQLIMLAARHAMPTVYPWRGAVTAGGLASYGIDLADSYRQVGDYIGRILKGAKPAELPVLQPAKISLAINLQTARNGVRQGSTVLRIAPTIIPIKFDQVECIKEHDLIEALGLEVIERCDPIITTGDRLPVDNAGP